jgi:hypothetical protein
MFRQGFAILISVLALAGFAWGCGSDDGGEPLTKAEFIEQGDAACKEANAKGHQQLLAFLEENGRKDSSLSKADEEEAVETIVLPLIDAQIEGLDGREVPEGDEGQVDAIVASLEEVRAEAEADPTAVTATFAFHESRALAEEYGFKVCGTNNK